MELCSRPTSSYSCRDTHWVCPYPKTSSCVLHFCTLEQMMQVKTSLQMHSSMYVSHWVILYQDAEFGNTFTGLHEISITFAHYLSLSAHFHIHSRMSSMLDLFYFKDNMTYGQWGWPAADGTVSYYYPGTYEQIVNARWVPSHFRCFNLTLDSR